MTAPLRRVASLGALLLLTGCANRKLLKLENELLKRQNAELREQLEGCEQNAPPRDFATEVDMAVLQSYLQRAGFPPGDLSSPEVLIIPVSGHNTNFQLIFQLFTSEDVLYIATHDYLRIEEAASSKAMVLLLTQVATLNYELLLGKFQLNPNTGSISLSVELNLQDGLGYRTFEEVLRHLVQTADARYPELLRTAQSMGI